MRHARPNYIREEIYTLTGAMRGRAANSKKEQQMEHQQEIFEASRRLRDAAKHDFKGLPGGSVSGYLNTLSPEARMAIAVQFKGLEHFAETGGRIDQNGHMKPFAPRVDESEIRDAQPKELNATIDRIQTEQITHDLTSRMGTPSAADQQSDGPPDRRETLSAAFDAFTQE